jgi:hypothetical protein
MNQAGMIPQRVTVWKFIVRPLCFAERSCVSKPSGISDLVWMAHSSTAVSARRVSLKAEPSFGDMLATLRRRLRAEVLTFGLRGPGSRKANKALENLASIAA